MANERRPGGAKLSKVDPKLQLGPGDATIGKVDQGEGFGGNDAWLVSLADAEPIELLRMIAIDTHETLHVLELLLEVVSQGHELGN